uniref:Putative secreted salivary protein n=1 Tax=Ixodes ricinus TaxID=34613 RepID=A0A090XE67_IXORI
MQLVVFAVVLILPALQSEGFFSGTEHQDGCMAIILACRRSRLRDSVDLVYYKILILCSAHWYAPEAVGRSCQRWFASDNDLNCTRFVREALPKLGARDWRLH